jgi:hypothetical protein
MKVPVLLVIFNRPDKVLKVIESIKLYQPEKLYIAADGPRVNNNSDLEGCQKSRDVVNNKIDWKCEIITLYGKDNKGCSESVSGAVSWFFENEELGIILEDDCVPSKSFYIFCEEMLDKYKKDTRIASISGTNFIDTLYDYKYSYFFSKYPHCWGWATWKRSWLNYDHNMLGWNEFYNNQGLDNFNDCNKTFNHVWGRMVNSVIQGKENSWAYRWTISCWQQNALTITPSKNLVSNIGYGENGTHPIDKDSPIINLLKHELKFPMKHPTMIYRNIAADKMADEIVFNINIVSKIKALFIRLLPEKVVNFISNLKRR